MPANARRVIPVYSPDETIAAIASAPGGAARGIVRISGPAVPRILQACLCSRAPSPLPNCARVVSGTIAIGDSRSGVPVDVYYWPTGRSYTRQIAAEIHTLGSPPLVAAVLAVVCAAGARLAEPGEFTLRAFLAGRLDLTQAEAVLGVIDARGQQQFDRALALLAGGLARPLARLRESLLELLADLEAGLDFVDEDIVFTTRDQIARQLDSAASLLEKTRLQLVERRASDELPRVALVGRPNAGKSSLFNALVESARALVSDIPGTTRDYLTATLELEGRACLLIDTAGHDPTGTLGAIGHAAQQMTTFQARDCDIELFCLDATRSTNDDERFASGAPIDSERLTVWTKCDQARGQMLPPGAIATSARTGAGLPELRRFLAGTLARLDAQETAGMTAQRCAESLAAAGRSLGRAWQLNGSAAGDELVASELRAVLGELGKVAGVVYTDDILDRVFSRFCIGK